MTPAPTTLPGGGIGANAAAQALRRLPSLPLRGTLCSASGGRMSLCNDQGMFKNMTTNVQIPS